jgi:hypothetical protein
MWTGIAQPVLRTRYELDGPEIESRCGRDFPHHPFRSALGLTQPPTQWVFSGGKATGAWCWSPILSSADVKKLYLYSPSEYSWPVMAWNWLLPLFNYPKTLINSQGTVYNDTTPFSRFFSAITVYFLCVDFLKFPTSVRWHYFCNN